MPGDCTARGCLFQRPLPSPSADRPLGCQVFPSLRSDSGLIAFNRQLKRCDNDLVRWREQAEKRGTPELMHGFELLDLNGGLGWQLVQVRPRLHKLLAGRLLVVMGVRSSESGCGEAAISEEWGKPVAKEGDRKHHR